MSQAPIIAGQHLSTGNLASILEEMSCAIASGQAALLSGQPRELEKSALQQQDLCRQLETALHNRGHANGNLNGTAYRELTSLATSARERNRVFTAVLRQMHMKLKVWQNARCGRSVVYQRPAARPTRGH